MNDEDKAEIHAVRASLDGVRTTLRAVLTRTASAEQSILRSKRALRISYALVVLDLVLSMVVLALFLDRGTLQNCQAQIAQEAREGLAARSQAADAATDAELAYLDALDAVVRNSPQDATQAQKDAAREAWLAAGQRKRAALLATKQARADNPVTTDDPCQ